MTKDEIIAMAREAGLSAMPANPNLTDYVNEKLIQFASLVAAAEREACAQICSLNAEGCGGTLREVLESNAAAIRARTN